MTDDNAITPSPTADNGGGRQADGRFTKGNRFALGNPHAAAVGAWRTALVECVTGDDLRAVFAALVQEAKAGAPWAVRELLDRCLGKPKLPMEIEATLTENRLPDDYLEFLDQRKTT